MQRLTGFKILKQGIYPEAILMLFSVMVKTSYLSHIFFHWSVCTC